MAENFYPVRSVKRYFNDFIYEGLVKKHLDPKLVKNQILDAFHKEIFNQLMTNVGDPGVLAKDISTIDPETKRRIDNIISNSVRKWKRLCIETARYDAIHNLLLPSDLMVTLEDIVKAQIDNNNTTNDDVSLLNDDI